MRDSKRRTPSASSGGIVVEETIRTICWAFVAFGAMSGMTTYAVVRLLVTGRPLFERRQAEQEESKVIRMGR